MNRPPSYPRVPRLDGADGDDIGVSREEARRWLEEPVIVEEKLDGANVAVWSEGRGCVEVAGRGGPGAMDRGQQLGRLRAWAGERLAGAEPALQDVAVYGEWLWLEHSVAYGALPDLLIVLDVWSPTRGFLPVEERDRWAADAGLATPPRSRRGVVGGIDTLRVLTERSAYANGPAEGVILRRDHGDGAFDRCKWVRPAFARKDDAGWRGPRHHNRVAG